MQNLAVEHKYTLEEYAELEKNSEERLKYFEGNVWSMADASPKHEDIVSNKITELKNKLRGRGCKVFGSNLRVKIPISKPYRYPDVTEICEQPIYESFFGLEILVNPSLIVEILSPSTTAMNSPITNQSKVLPNTYSSPKTTRTLRSTQNKARTLGCIVNLMIYPPRFTYLH